MQEYRRGQCILHYAGEPRILQMGSSLEESTGGGQYILHYAGDPRSRGEGQYSVQEESTGGGQSSLKPEYRVT